MISKLPKLKTTNQLLDEKYGEHGTPTREAFNEKTMAWYYGDILRDRRKALKLTQKQLATASWQYASSSAVISFKPISNPSLHMEATIGR